MHQHAEYGVAAHWLYKQAGNSEGNKASDVQRLDNQLAWLGPARPGFEPARRPVDPGAPRGPSNKLFESEVFFFTPKGEVRLVRALDAA